MTETGHFNIKHPVVSLLMIVTLLLLPAVFMSIELCDTGFYLTYYDNFFSAPQSVEYTFMYYLTGLFGGIIDSLGQPGGLLFMRICGLLFLLSASVIAWRYPGETVSANVKTVAIIGIMASYSSSPIIISYDIVTILFLALTVTLLVEGIIRANRKAIFIAGILTGIMLFIRIPNLLQVFLIILIPIYSHNRVREKWILSLLFISGFLSGILIILLLMILLGHTSVFLHNVRTLVDLSSDPEASHGLSHLIMVQVHYYINILIVVVKLLVMALCLRGIWSIAKSGWIRTALSIPVMAYFIYMTYNISPVKIIGAVVIPPLLIISLQRKKGKKSLIATGALLSSLIFPLGSDGAGENIGSILYLLGAAPALSFWLKFKINLRCREFYIPRKPILIASVLFSLICILRTYCGGLYFDNTPIWEMNSQSSSQKLKGILMSEERRNVIDEILPLLNQYVSPGDTLFAYGSIPMLNYLTSTRPYLGNSWPEQVSAGRLEHLLKDEELKNNFPAICIQRFRTIGSSWGVPSDAFMKGEDSDSNVYHSSKKWLVLQDFLDRNSYRKIDSTPHFEILIR